MAWFRLRPRKSQLGVPRQSPVVPIDFDIDEPAASDQAWLNSTLELRSGLTVMAAGFLGVLAYDIYGARRGFVPAWYPRLRWPLTGIALISLFGAILAGPL